MPTRRLRRDRATTSTGSAWDKIGRVIRYFRRHGVTQATMAGKVHKVLLYRRWPGSTTCPTGAGCRRSTRTSSPAARTLQDDTLLGAIVAAFRSPAASR